MVLYIDIVGELPGKRPSWGGELLTYCCIVLWHEYITNVPCHLHYLKIV
jgi:hypothetical protein